MKYLNYFFVFGLLWMLGCIRVENPYTKIPPGIWRGTLKIDNKPVDTAYREPTLETIGKLKMQSVTEGELPFLFEVIYTDKDSFYIQIINAEERIRVDQIDFGHNKKTAYDTIRIDFPEYDSYIRANVVGPIMEGYWVVNYRKDNNNNIYRIPFKAEFSKNERFSDLKVKPKTNVSGAWKIIFMDQDPYVGIAEFKQDNNHLSATIRTETGDYRYLEGLIQKDKIYLSVFDGSHAFLLESKLLDDDEMYGTFASGKHYKVGWTARRNDSFELRNPYEMTKVVHQNQAFDFSFLNTENQKISLSDKTFAHTVKIVEIMGTWCPNCMDATNYLLELRKKYPKNKLSIVSVSFERYRDKAKAMEQIIKYKKKKKLSYPILYGGYADKNEVQQKFKLLDKIFSFPTLILLDKNNQIQKIYTGFNGPATSKYRTFCKEFEANIDTLLLETD